MRFGTTLLAGAAAAMFSVSASAVFVVTDWTFNAVGLDANGVPANGVQAGNGVVNNVSFLGFQNTFHTVLTAPVVGGTFNVQASGLITNFFDATTTNINPFGYGVVGTAGGINGWELTFDFNINGVFNGSGPGSTLTFDHTSGTLNFYVDSLPTAAPATICSSFTSVPSCTTTGAGGGVLVASFAVVSDVGDPNFGGIFDPNLGNGGDRSLFALTFNPFGVFRDSANNALALGTTLAISNSDFQSNVAGSPPFSYNPSAYTCGGSVFNFCGTESGQFRLAAAPEPGTIALLSLGLLAVGGFARRSKKAQLQGTL